MFIVKMLFSCVVFLLTFDSIKSQAAGGSCAALEISPIINLVLTPFKTNGDLNLNMISEYAQYLKDNGIPDILVLGYTGEASLMNLCDRTALIRAWVAAASPLGIGVLVQIAGGLPFIETLILAELCVELNVKAIVVLPETIYSPQTVDEAVADLQLIANVAVGIPILYEEIRALESIGVVSAVEILKSAVEKIPCLSGITTFNINTAEEIKATPSLADKTIIIGGHQSISAALKLGFSSTLNSVTNFFPRLAFDIIAAVQAEDHALTNRLQTELILKVAAIIGDGDLATKPQTRAYIVNQKVAFELIAGFKIAIPRLPLEAATFEVVNQIANALTELDVPLVSTVESVLEDVL